MKRKALKALKWLAIVVLLLDGGVWLSWSMMSPETQLLTLVNAERIIRFRAPLWRNERLANAAKAKLYDMTEKGYYGHHDLGGQSFSVIVESYGYNGGVGENLNADVYQGHNLYVLNTNPVWRFHRSFMRSKGHRENLLNSDHQHAGFAFGETYKHLKDQHKDGRIRTGRLVVQLFGQ